MSERLTLESGKTPPRAREFYGVENAEGELEKYEIPQVGDFIFIDIPDDDSDFLGEVNEDPEREMIEESWEDSLKVIWQVEKVFYKDVWHEDEKYFKKEPFVKILRINRWKDFVEQDETGKEGNPVFKKVEIVSLMDGHIHISHLESLIYKGSSKITDDMSLELELVSFVKSCFPDFLKDYANPLQLIKNLPDKNLMAIKRENPDLFERIKLLYLGSTKGIFVPGGKFDQDTDNPTNP